MPLTVVSLVASVRLFTSEPDQESNDDDLEKNCIGHARVTSLFLY